MCFSRAASTVRVGDMSAGWRTSAHRRPRRYCRWRRMDVGWSPLMYEKSTCKEALANVDDWMYETMGNHKAGA